MKTTYMRVVSSLDAECSNGDIPKVPDVTAANLWGLMDPVLS